MIMYKYMSNKLCYMIIILLCVIYLFLVVAKECNRLNPIIIDSGIPGPNILFIGGTHGNEPSGTVGLDKVAKLFNNKQLKLKCGSLTILSKANKCGLMLNYRYLPHELLNNDLNRNYSTYHNEYSSGPISREIVKLVSKNELVIDFHEAWGFHKLNSRSMGSGIYINELTYGLGKIIQNKINNTITCDYKKFIVDNKNDGKLKTLQNHCKYKNKPYVLIETTGQNNIQPLNIRVGQVLITINTVLNEMGMI
jgi:hypothetical protein